MRHAVWHAVATLGDPRICAAGASGPGGPVLARLPADGSWRRTAACGPVEWIEALSEALRPQVVRSQSPP